MKDSSLLTKMVVEGTVLPPFLRPPGSSKNLFLGGAGERGLDVDGVFIVFTVHGLYLEESAVQLLAAKWKGKTAEEIAVSLEFYCDIIEGPYEKLSRMTLKKPLTGQQFSEKVAENCIAIWQAKGINVEEQGDTIEKFYQVFKSQMLLPDSVIFFAFHPSGVVTIAFSKDGTTTPESGTVIESRALTEAILESIIGEHGVSPALKLCLASRIVELMKEHDDV